MTGPYLDPDVSGDAMRWSPTPPPPRPFHSRRDERFQYAHDAIEHVEETSCSRGCALGAAPGSPEYEEFGPGGTCHVLAMVALGDGQAVTELDDQGDRVVCSIRVPVSTAPSPPVDDRPPVPVCEGQLDLLTLEPS